MHQRASSYHFGKVNCVIFRSGYSVTQLGQPDIDQGRNIYVVEPQSQGTLLNTPNKPLATQASMSHRILSHISAEGSYSSKARGPAANQELVQISSHRGLLTSNPPFLAAGVWLRSGGTSSDADTADAKRAPSQDLCHALGH